MKTSEITKKLKTQFSGSKFTPCTRRNGRPAPGWTVPGKSKWTSAVKAAGLPWNHFWSGSAHTPSTQYPAEIAGYLALIDD